jgi:hypothetical protein
VYPLNGGQAVSSIHIKSILEAAAAGRAADALAETNALLRDHPDCPYLLVWQAILIQVQDPAGAQTLEDAEASLLRAHATDSNYLPALQELAHYYDAVSPDQEKARIFASRYIEKSQKVLDEMRTIVNAPA